jgi:MFS family permease
MYRLDWIEQLKLKTAEMPKPRQVAVVSPAVWNLGWTSLLTDVSAEMVNSVIPVYLVLHLHLSPLRYGAIDGIYNGFAVVLLSLIAGLAADRGRRHKQIAVAGYGLSTLCKIALLFVGGAWTAIMGVMALDRAGKGIRTAPRDALISLHTRSESLATAFAAHRALDAGGMLLGPIVAFGVLWVVPNSFDAVWIASFAFGILGVAVLVLFVPEPDYVESRSTASLLLTSAFRLFRSPRFSALAICAFGLALATISDAFVYLQLQKKSGTDSSFFPLFYVLTAAAYMLLSLPAGRLGDRYGRLPVFLSGYVVLAVMYFVLHLVSTVGSGGLIAFVVSLGAYYAVTEGILMAMASAIIPPEFRTSGIALIATCVGLGKLGSSLLFGYAWHTLGADTAVWCFAFGLVVCVVGAILMLRGRDYEKLDA